MDTNLLYDRVCAAREVSQEDFLSYLNYTLCELCAIYGEEFVMNGPLRRVERVGDTAGVREVFAAAVEDDLMYLATGDERHKTDFAAHAAYAYNTLWREKNLGRRVRREAW